MSAYRNDTPCRRVSVPLGGVSQNVLNHRKIIPTIFGAGGLPVWISKDGF
jgi:hypothetical protein